MLGDAPVLAGRAPEIFIFVCARRRGRAFGCLAPPQRLRDEFVGEHKLCFRHLFDRQKNVGVLARGRIGAAHASLVAVDTNEEISSR